MHIKTPLNKFLLLLLAALYVVPSAYAAPATPSAKPAGKSSAKTQQLTSAEAVRIVSSMPEVKEWDARVRKSGNKKVTPIVEFDRTEDGAHVVHVYEQVMDSPDEGHTATFNWYHVNIKTRKVTKEF